MTELYPKKKWKEVGTHKSIHKPPALAGVYIIFIYDMNEGKKIPLYVGRSQNIKKRFISHLTYSKIFKEYGNRRGYFISVKIKRINKNKELEKRMIQKLRPKYNKVYNWNTI